MPLGHRLPPEPLGYLGVVPLGHSVRLLSRFFFLFFPSWTALPFPRPFAELGSSTRVAHQGAARHAHTGTYVHIDMHPRTKEFLHTYILEHAYIFIMPTYELPRPTT